MAEEIWKSLKKGERPLGYDRGLCPRCRRESKKAIVIDDISNYPMYEDLKLPGNKYVKSLAVYVCPYPKCRLVYHEIYEVKYRGIFNKIKIRKAKKRKLKLKKKGTATPPTPAASP